MSIAISVLLATVVVVVICKTHASVSADFRYARYLKWSERMLDKHNASVEEVLDVILNARPSNVAPGRRDVARSAAASQRPPHPQHPQHPHLDVTQGPRGGARPARQPVADR